MSTWVRLLGVLGAWALVVAACSPSTVTDDTTPTPTSVTTTIVEESTTTTTSTTTFPPGEMRVGEGSPVDVPAGPGAIRVPSEAVSGPGMMVVESVSVTPPEGFKSVGGAFDVSLDGTDLSGAVEFSMPAPSPPPDFPQGVPTAWLVTFDDVSGVWVPIETVVVDGVLVAQVGHFSWFSWITPDLDWLGDAFLGLVESVLGTGLMGVGHPVCDGESDAVDAGVDVASDDGSSTMWCVGIEDGQTVLKVTNNRRYAVGVNTPPGFQVLHRDADSGVVEILTQHSEGTFGFDVTLSRGETVVFAVSDDASGLVVVEPSPATFLLDVLSLEVDFAASVLAPEGAAAAALVGKCLGDNETDLFGDDTQGNVSAAFSFGFGCLSDSWEDFFPSGVMVRMVWGFLSSAIRLVLEGLVGSISGILDTVSGMFDGSDIYRVSIVMPQEPVSTDEAADLIGCTGDCQVTGTIPFQHPTWGPSTLATYFSEHPGEAVGIVVFDASREVVWRSVLDGQHLYDLSPRGQSPYSGDDPSRSAADSLGHLFLEYSLGRYAAVIVLVPTRDGFDDLGSLPNGDSDSQRFPFAVVVDVDGDGRFELREGDHSCLPSCAEGSLLYQILVWDGADYVTEMDVAAAPIHFDAYTDFYEGYGDGQVLWSGCAPIGGAELPDGKWMGYVDGLDASGLDFDLACDYGWQLSFDTEPRTLVVNDDPGVRRLPWSDDAYVYGFDEDLYVLTGPEPVDALVSGSLYLDPPNEYGSPAVIYVNDGVVTGLMAIHRP